MREIKCYVTDEYLQSDSDFIGAVGSHHDVALRLEFNNMWDNLIKQITWKNATGEQTVFSLINSNMLVSRSTNIYIVPIPAEAKSALGEAIMSVKGYTTSTASGETVENMATLTVTKKFTVADSVVDPNAEAEQQPSATVTQQLQSAIEGKVDKVTGKGLSTNDYDNIAKSKVDAIPTNPHYTDTVYDDTALSGRVSTIESKEAGWDAKATSGDITSAISTHNSNKSAHQDIRGILNAKVGDGQFNQTVDNINASIATKQNIISNSNKLSFNLISDVPSFVTKAVNDLENYYKKSEVDTKISQVASLQFEVVQTLPATGVGNKIYLLPKTQSTNNIYDEYIYVNNAWELIGSTEIDLSNYYTKSEVDTEIQYLTDGINSKVTANNQITGATKAKITYDDKGLVTSGSDLIEDDIPDLHLSKITDITATTEELNYTKGVTNGIQAQLDSKADKVSSATNGNFAGLDSNGNLTDSGKKPSDFQDKIDNTHKLSYSLIDDVPIIDGEESDIDDYIFDDEPKIYRITDENGSEYFLFVISVADMIQMTDITYQYRLNNGTLSVRSRNRNSSWQWVWSNWEQISFSGNYNDLIGKPDIKQYTFRNLLNLNDPDYTTGKFVNHITGGLSNSGSYNASGYIPVNGGDRICITLKTTIGTVSFRQPVTIAPYFAFYDDNKSFMNTAFKDDITRNNYIIVPNGAKYIRVTIDNSSLTKEPMVEKYTDIGVSETYLNYGTENTISMPLYDAGTDMFLPPYIYGIKNKPFDIYTSAIFGDTKNRFQLEQLCWVLSRFGTIDVSDRRIKINPIGAYGQEYYLKAKNSANKTVAATSTTILINNGSTATKSIVTIGDSLTNAKPWISEILKFNSNYNFVGTYAAQGVDSEGTNHIFHHDGRSGWTAQDYCTSASKSSVVNSFWDGSEFSFSHYVTNTLSGTAPDIVIIFLGMNNLQSDIDTAINYEKSMVYNIRTSYPNMPIVICSPQARDYTYASFVAKNGYEMNKKLFETFSYYSKIYFVPLYLLHDSENNYKIVNEYESVNPRSQIMTNKITDSTHPQNAGYWQFADAIYGALSAIG